MVSQVIVGTKNVLLTIILYFQIHNKYKTTLVAVLSHQTTQVISLYSGGLMTENRNSGVFLILSFFLHYNSLIYFVYISDLSLRPDPHLTFRL